MKQACQFAVNSCGIDQRTFISNSDSPGKLDWMALMHRAHYIINNSALYIRYKLIHRKSYCCIMLFKSKALFINRMAHPTDWDR